MALPAKVDLDHGVRKTSLELSRQLEMQSVCCPYVLMSYNFSSTYLSYCAASRCDADGAQVPGMAMATTFDRAHVCHASLDLAISHAFPRHPSGCADRYSVSGGCKGGELQQVVGLVGSRSRMLSKISCNAIVRHAADVARGRRHGMGRRAGDVGLLGVGDGQRNAESGAGAADVKGV